MALLMAPVDPSRYSPSIDVRFAMIRRGRRTDPRAPKNLGGGGENIEILVFDQEHDALGFRSKFELWSNF